MWLWWVKMPSRDFTGVTFQATVETFKTTWKLFRPPEKLSRPPGNFPPGNFSDNLEIFQATFQATWKLSRPPWKLSRPPGNFPCQRWNFQVNLETFPDHLETFNATWKLSRPPENFPDHSGNDHFNANIFVYCVQKVFYDGGSPYGGSTASKASGSPLSPFQAEEKSEQPLSINVDHLITCDDKTMKMAQTCAPNETHLCWWRSSLGPHITQNWVPIGSPFWTKLGPHGTWEQWIRWMKVYEKWHKRVALAMICRKLFKEDQISTFSAFRFPHGS